MSSLQQEFARQGHPDREALKRLSDRFAEAHAPTPAVITIRELAIADKANQKRGLEKLKANEPSPF